MVVIGVSLASPSIRKVYDRAGYSNRFGSFQGIHEYSPLLVLLKRFAHGVAKGPAEIHGPGRLDLFGYFPLERYGYRGDAGLLDYALYQPHGLIAEPSGRGEDHKVDPVPPQQSGDSRGGLLQQPVEVSSHDMPHKTVAMGGRFTDKMAGCELL